MQNEFIANIQKEKDALIRTIAILMTNKDAYSFNTSEVEISSNITDNSTETTKTNKKKKK